jgi:hypothetical protein
MKFANGDSYKGSFERSKFNGYGVYRWQDGTEYKGNFQDGSFEGIGGIVSQANRGQKTYALKAIWSEGVISSPDTCQFEEC